MHKEVAYIAFDGKDFDTESECRKYEKSKIINITKEMTDELNQLLKEQGCVFNFRFDTYLTDPSIGVIYPKFINNKFLHFNSKCEIDENGKHFIREFFKTKGIDWITCTTANGYMSYQYDDIKY